MSEALYKRHADELLSDNTHNTGYEQCKDCVYSGKPGTAAYSRCICDKYPLSDGDDQWATCKPDGIEDGSKICYYKQVKNSAFSKHCYKFNINIKSFRQIPA